MPTQRVKELYQSMTTLLAGWAAWDTEEDYYLNELLPSLMVAPSTGTKTEQELKDVETMLSRRATFAEVRENPNFELMAKQRLTMAKRNLFEQMDAVAV